MDTPQPEATVNYQLLPIQLLRESKSNPRRRFEGVEQLADSIHQHGVLVPLLVRPMYQEGEDRRHAMAEGQPVYEIVAGARRIRAAQKAGLTEVPATVREMSDSQVMEIQLIENLQRAGIHPMDEARGYQALIERAGYTQERIAERIGRDRSHVAKRLALLRLAKEAQEVYLAHKIHTEHAILIARLQPADQKRALGVVFDRWRGTMTKRELNEWIERDVYINLRAAPFALKDGELLPAAGACDACPKRAGSAPALFSDVKRDDTCTDPACYQRKLDAHIQVTTKKLEASGKKFLRLSGDQFNRYEKKKPTPGVLYRDDYRDIEPASKACQFAGPGLIVEGRDRGQVVMVCASKGCTQHFRSSPSRTPGQIASERKAKRQARINEQTQRQGMEAVLKKISSPLLMADLRMVVGACFEMAGHDVRMRLCKWLSIEPEAVAAQGGYKDYHKGFERHIEKLDAAGLNRLLIAVMLTRSVAFGYTTPKEGLLQQTARRHGVDLAKIRERVAAEISGAQS